MWQVQKKETFDIWTNNVCALKIEHLEDKCRVYVDYKGYNVIMPMGMWGFEDEIQDRKIEFEIDGEKGNFKSLSYVVKESDLKLFCDMIFFFLSTRITDCRILLKSENSRMVPVRPLLTSMGLIVTRYSFRLIRKGPTNRAGARCSWSLTYVSSGRTPYSRRWPSGRSSSPRIRNIWRLAVRISSFLLRMSTPSSRLFTSVISSLE